MTNERTVQRLWIAQKLPGIVYIYIIAENGDDGIISEWRTCVWGVGGGGAEKGVWPGISGGILQVPVAYLFVVLFLALYLNYVKVYARLHEDRRLEHH